MTADEIASDRLTIKRCWSIRWCGEPFRLQLGFHFDYQHPMLSLFVPGGRLDIGRGYVIDSYWCWTNPRPDLSCYPIPPSS